MRVRRSDQELRFNETVGRRLAAFRNGQGLSQAQFGARMGINKVTLSSYERGVNPIPLYSLLRIASAFKVSLADLIGPSVQKDPAVNNEELTAE